MTQFSEQSASFTQDRGSRSELNAEEEAAVSAAREILFRHISRNPVLTSWAAVVDYCSFSVRGDVERFHVLYGTAPGVMSATAYLAARRLDVAIRPLDGVSPRAALEEAWRATASDLPW